MENRPGFLSLTGALIAAVSLLAVVAWGWIGGAAMFSPGSLNAMTKAGARYGGVISHAQLRDCSACHTTPWSSKTMADRCVACHTDVSAQIQGHSGLHGGLLGALAKPTCGGCHSEHMGPNGPLTANFNHNMLTFKLIGKHATVPCEKCHTSASTVQDLRNTPQDCYSCHAKDDNHAGKFGTQCGQCHTPAGWGDASFDHSIFPVNHGASEQVATCKTCHPNDVSTYTCFGCHRHTPATVANDHEGRNVTQLADCIRCHAGGRQGGD